MEVVTGLRFIQGLLVADVTLMAAVTGVYEDAAPIGAAFPFMTLGYQQDGENELALDGTFVCASLSYVVKVVGQGGSFAALETIAERSRTVLHKKSGAAGNGEVYECVQVAPVAYREDAAGGVKYCHLGGLYELVVRG